jgi:tRNA A37 threonylcarbamoyladenosine biosynthesis protein TsaE
MCPATKKAPAKKAAARKVVVATKKLAATKTAVKRAIAKATGNTSDVSEAPESATAEVSA